MCVHVQYVADRTFSRGWKSPHILYPSRSKDACLEKTLLTVEGTGSASSLECNKLDS